MASLQSQTHTQNVPNSKKMDVFWQPSWIQGILEEFLTCLLFSESQIQIQRTNLKLRDFWGTPNSIQIIPLSCAAKILRGWAGFVCHLWVRQVVWVYCKLPTKGSMKERLPLKLLVFGWRSIVDCLSLEAFLLKGIELEHHAKPINKHVFRYVEPCPHPANLSECLLRSLNSELCVMSYWHLQVEKQCFLLPFPLTRNFKH